MCGSIGFDTHGNKNNVAIDELISSNLPYYGSSIKGETTSTVTFVAIPYTV